MARDNKQVVALAEELRLRGESFGFAESCTGGLASSMVTAVAGVSDVFAGSVVAYSNHVKENVLGVSRSSLAVHGAVSVPVVRAMAGGARVALGCHWAVAITGIAGPNGGSPQKPVGMVCFGVRGPGVDRTLVEQFSGARTAVQKAAAERAVELLLEELVPG